MGSINSPVNYKDVIEEGFSGRIRHNMENIQFSDNPIILTSTEDGIHLEGSILWLDSNSTGELSFLSNPQGATSKLNSRVIATEETVRILEAFRKKPQGLICQYNRPFAIGPLHMELLPSGVGLGGASLWIEVKNRKILYAPQLQPANSHICHHMQIRQADTLILSAKNPFVTESHGSRKREKERLLAKIEELLEAGLYPRIYCELYTTAPEIAKMLGDKQIPLAVSSSIAKILKVYEAYGTDIGNYTIFSESKPESKVVLLPTPSQKTQKQGLPQGPILSIQDNHGPKLDDGLFTTLNDRFYIPSSCDGKDLKSVITKVDPKEIYIFGPYAKDYVRHMRHWGPEVKALFPRHLPSLF